MSSGIAELDLRRQGTCPAKLGHGALLRVSANNPIRSR